MKRSIYYTLLFFFLLGSSCENEISFNPDEKPAKLVVNAFLTAGEDANAIYLNLTGKDRLTVLRDATVLFQINDQLAEEMECIRNPQDMDDMFFLNRSSLFPGDKIRIDATTKDGNHHAWAEAVVPEIVPIEKVETDTMVIRIDGSFREYLRCRITLTDPSLKKNYYRLLIQHEVSIRETHPDMGEVRNETYTKKSMMIRDDLVLTDGYPIPIDQDIVIMDRPQNIYGIFDDSRISGETYTLTAYTDLPSYEYIARPTPDSEMYVKLDLHVRLFSINEIEYTYLRAMNELDSESYDPVISAPVIFPSNVEGGLGFVGVSSESWITIPVFDGIVAYEENEGDREYY